MYLKITPLRQKSVAKAVCIFGCPEGCLVEVFLSKSHKVRGGFWDIQRRDRLLGGSREVCGKCSFLRATDGRPYGVETSFGLYP